MSVYPDVLDMALRGDNPSDRLLAELKDVDIPPAPQPIDWWLREPGAPPPPDLEVLEWVPEGQALDIGCCTGRQLEILAERGVRGHGIDIAPTAISMAKEAGLSCSLADVNDYQPPHPFDAVLLLGGNGGIAGSLEALPGFLQRLASWLRPGGAIVFTSSDFRPLLGPGGLTTGTPDGYWGDRKVRHRMGDRTSAWFPWLFIDMATLADVCTEIGLRITRQKKWLDGTVLAASLKSA